MAEMVEHQATVETGLKMKIKRKNPTQKTSAELRCKAAAAGSEDKNGNIKSRKTKPDNREVAGDFAPTTQTTEEKVSEETLKEPEERPQKRKRNAKSIRQTTIQNGVDYEVTKGNKSKPDSDSHSKAQVTSAKDKPKNGKICPPEKASRKRAASVCAVVPVVSSCETPKAKSLRITTYDKDTVIEEKNTDCRKPGYSGMKTDTEDSPHKAESKSSQQPQPHGEIPSQAALSLRGGGDDPYEFVAKVEDVIQTPIKKFKSDKADLTSFPAEPFLSAAAAAAVAGVGTVGGGGHHDIATETCSVGVTTDPDCLGPCEPGTSVILEGIVWSESNNGILVVNVTWRGKTYVGTLMDTTKHHWASPRFRDDSPIPEVDWRSPKSKRTSGTTPVVEVLEGRRLRNSRQRNIPASSSCTSSSSLKGTSNTLRVQSPVQLEANNGRRRAQRMADNADMTTSSSNCIMTQPLKKTRPAMTNENDGEDPLLECTLLNCNKKFKHISGLNYHQSHAHRKTLVDESKPGGGKVPSAAMDGNLEATLSTETGETEVTHEENANCGVESTEVLSADVVVPVTDEVDLAGSRAQSDCSMNKSVCSVVNLPVSLSIASSCTSGAPVVDASGPGFDGKHPQKIKNNHASSPPPRPSKPVEEEPSSESEQSSGLSRSPPLRQVPPPPPQDFKPNDGGKSLRASDAEKNRLAETKINGSPTPLVLSSKSPSNPSHHPLPVGSDDKEGRSCVIPSTGDHQSQSETPTTGPGLSASAVTNVSSSPLASSFSSSSGFLIGADNKSPNYSDISDSAEFISGQMDYSRANGHQPQQQGKDGATRKQQRPMFDSRQQKSKQETTGAAQSHSSSTSGISALPHLSVPQSNGNHAGYDAVRQQKMKDPSAAKETIDSSSAAANSSYTKPATPEEKPAISQIAYHADAADAQAKEHRLWLENLHHQHHQNSAIASSMAMASSAAAAMNMMPYGYGLDQAAYHLQFLSQNPETRSHYERWLMEQSHYLQQQQQHHHQQQQQQRCFSKLMQVETERGPPSSDSKPVDMTSKGSIHPSNDSTASGLAPPFGGKPKGGRLGDGRPADSANKPLHKSTIALEANNDWMSVRHSHSIPSVNGIADSCGDSRRTTTAQPSGRNNASKEKLDGVKPPDQFHKGGKDALWERNERVVMNKEMGSPDDLTGGSSHLTPISKASNSVGNISPYSSGGLLKNLVFQDSSHQQSPPIGYSPSASFMEMSSSEAATSISPNSKFLDLDSKQVVTGSNLRRSGDGRHALDVLRYQSAMYGKQSSTAAEHLGSNGPKHNRSTLSKDFLEEPGHSKDGKGSPSGHSSPLTLRHLHTHHHTHVVGAAYPIYGSYNGLMSPVPAIVPSGPPVIAPTYLPK